MHCTNAKVFILDSCTVIFLKISLGGQTIFLSILWLNFWYFNVTLALQLAEVNIVTIFLSCISL